MSLTLYTTPSSLEPVYSPIWFRILSNSATTTNFRYVFDTYWKSTTGNTFTKINRSKLFPQIDGTGLYSPARILESYVTYDVKNLFNSGFTASLNSVCNYQIKFGEEFDLSGSTYLFSSVTNSGGYTRYNFPSNQSYLVGDTIKIDLANKAYNSNYDGLQTILTASTNYVVTDKPFGSNLITESGYTNYRLTIQTGLTFSGTAINFARQFYENNTDIPLKYNIKAGNLGKPLTNLTLVQDGAVSWNQFGTFTSINGNLINSSLELSPDEYYQVSYVSNDASYYPEYMLLYTYNSVGNQLGIFAIANQFSPNKNYCRFDFGIGAKNLENYVTNNILFGTINPIYTSEVTTIVFVPGFVTGSTFVQGGQSICARYATKCSPYQKHRLAFLNRLGGFDIISLNRKSTRKVNIEREIYTKYLNWNYTTADRGLTMLNVNADEEITANTDWLTETQARLVEELFLSPEVYYVIDSDKQVQPVIITSKEYITKNRANNKLVQYSINFKFSYKINLQRN